MIFKQKYWHELFEAGVLLKALNSVWETATGLLLLFSMQPIVHNVFLFLSREEYLGTTRDDALFRMVAEQFNHLSVSTRHFAGYYLLFHGLLNMFLAYNLYKNRLWAYPFAMGAVGLFLVYQLYRLVHTHSLVLFFITLFDIAFIVLTWHEYKFQRNQQAAA